MRMMVLAFVLVGFTWGCEKPQPSSPPQPPKPVRKVQVTPTRKTYHDSGRGISFKYPSAWSVEDVKQMNVLLAMCPIVEGDWQANVSFEVRQDNEGRTLEKALDDLTANLPSKHKGFRLVAKKMISLPQGIEAGQVEYFCFQDQTELKNCNLLLLMSDNRILYVLTSSVRSLAGKYQPIFDEIVGSIEIK